MSAPPPPKVVRPAEWRPVAVAPRLTSELPFVFVQEKDKLVVDESGGRWLFPPGEAPRTTALLDQGPVAARHRDAGGGLVVLSPDGRLQRSAEPLGTLSAAGELPSDVDAKSLRFLRGGLTARTPRGAIFVGREGVVQPVGGLAGYRLADVLLRADGVGVGLFWPETVAWTRDRGATWTPLPTADVRVTTLVAHEGAAVLLPGGVRDHFARTVDLENGQLSRMITPPGGFGERASEAVQPRPGRRGHRGLSLADIELDDGSSLGTGTSVPAVPKGPFRLELSLLRAGEDGTPVVGSNDRVIAFGNDPRGGAKPMMLRGVFGEGLTPFAEGALDGCEVAAATTCDEVTAVVCRDEIRVIGVDGTPRARLPATRESQVAFDGSGALVVIGRSRDEERAGLVVRRFGADYDVATVERDVLDLEATFPRLTGGCHRPALWISSGAHARKLDAAGVVDASLVTISPDALPIAVRFDGALVATNGVELQFFPEGTKTTLGPHSPGHVSFSTDGVHGLFVAPSGQVSQTDDGGRSFSPIVTPAVTGRLPVLCGSERCQLGSGAWRDGFVRDATMPAIAVWAEPPAPSTPAAGGQMRQKRLVAPIAPSMKCVADETAFRGATIVGELAPRMSTAARPLLFAATAFDDRGRALALFGDRTGQLVSRALPLRVPADGRELELSAVGTASAADNRWVDGELRSRAMFRWDADDAPTSWNATGASPTSLPFLLAEEGVVSADASAGELVLWGKRGLARRAYVDPGREQGAGVLAVEADGTWLLAHATDARTLRLTVLGATGQRDRLLAIGGEVPAEIAVGLVAGTPRRVVLLERRDDGGSELRLRAVRDDLSLGPAQAVPGASAPPEHLLDLPSCPAGATGALVRLISYGTRAIDLGSRAPSGHIDRLLRVDETRACVETTYLAPDGGRLTAEVVIAGNGGRGATHGTSPGLRCERLDPKPVAR